MIHLFKLIRLPNLITIALVQFLMRYFIMAPILKVKGFDLQLTNIEFMVLVLSTVLLAAGGYVINEYFDRRSDLINKPNEVVLVRKLKRRWGISINFLLNAIAVGLGLWLTIQIGIYKLGIIFLLVPLFFWIYSAYLKKIYLVGNLAVASFVALVPILVPIIEAPLFIAFYRESFLEINASLNNVYLWISSYAYFTFFSYLLYTTIKDAIGYHGDLEGGNKTIPVLLGLKNIKYFTSLIILIILAPSSMIVFKHLGDQISILYYLILIVLPLLVLLIQSILAKKPEHFRFSSVIIRIIMLAGILYILVANYLITENFFLNHVF
jgi:4-hydroxybenzoate polyprenyltransferase